MCHTPNGCMDVPPPHAWTQQQQSAWPLLPNLWFWLLVACTALPLKFTPELVQNFSCIILRWVHGLLDLLTCSAMYGTHRLVRSSRPAAQSGCPSSPPLYPGPAPRSHRRLKDNKCKGETRTLFSVKAARLHLKSSLPRSDWHWWVGAKNYKITRNSTPFVEPRACLHHFKVFESRFSSTQFYNRFNILHTCTGPGQQLVWSLWSGWSRAHSTWRTSTLVSLATLNGNSTLMAQACLLLHPIEEL